MSGARTRRNNRQAGSGEPRPFCGRVSSWLRPRQTHPERSAPAGGAVPKCVLQLANRGARKPDGGFFTADQFERVSDAEPVPGQLPPRGAIEVKPTKDDAWVTAEARQVTKYWNRYRQVLVTNCGDFVLVGQDAESNPAILESYRLAEGEKVFWQAAAAARSTPDKQNDRFVEYLQRVMRHAALEQALGLKFGGEKDEHFLRSSLVQTLFYGIFSTWVLWSATIRPPPESGSTGDSRPGRSAFP
jgi:hypothetical protein